MSKTETGKESKKSKEKQSKESSRKQKEATVKVNEEEEVIDLCDDHDYQVLSAVFETNSGRNIAEILSRLQKDVHLLAMSVHQLIQLSLASHSTAKQDSDEDNSDVSDEADSDDNGDGADKQEK
jgi:hypothetical protein